MSGPVRKRKKETEKVLQPKARKLAGVSDSNQEVKSEAEILLLEKSILESRKNFNKICTLLEYAKTIDIGSQIDIFASVSCCRVFCRLMAAGNLAKSQELSDNEAVIIQWLKERYQEFTNLLLQGLEAEESSRQSTALTLLMRLVKEEKVHLSPQGDAVWRSGIFPNIIRTIIHSSQVENVREEFVQRYINLYDDVRYYAFARLPEMIAKDAPSDVLQNSLSILAATETIPENQESCKTFYVGAPSKAKHDMYSLASHKKQAQKAWMSLISHDLTKFQRKAVLDLMSHRIVPWFVKVEQLMDFLTDSFNIGGSMSLSALSGLFHLIQYKNLDYPQFYRKVYSLLDANILHSKHRSRFFRLLDTFLASTHLPAALVASFIKRLSRLTLYAPPSGIVVVVPWIYNLLKNHPSCTFMIHRECEIDQNEEDWGDPFRMEEPDPMETDALESSLWEIQMLQSHYHPNVATIAKIISEQFTKQLYNMEDFLDHSYGTMLETELTKNIKKAPEIQFEIPKRILTKYDADSGKSDSLLVNIWSFM